MDNCSLVSFRILGDPVRDQWDFKGFLAILFGFNGISRDFWRSHSNLMGFFLGYFRILGDPVWDLWDITGFLAIMFEFNGIFRDLLGLLAILF